MIRSILLIACLLVSSFASAQVTNGKEGLYVGQVFFSVTQVYPHGYFKSLSSADLEDMRKDGEVDLESDKLIGKLQPMQGEVVKLGNLISTVDKDGYFSFNSIPTGVTQGQFCKNYSDPSEGSFEVSDLVKKGQGDPKPVIIRHEVNIGDTLQHT